MRIGEANTEQVVGTSGRQTGDIDAGIEIEIDLVPVAGRAEHARENADALGGIALRRENLLIKHGVKTVIAGHDCGCEAGHRKGLPVSVITLVGKIAQVLVGAEPDDARKPRRALVLIIFILDFLHQQRTVPHAEIQAEGVASLRVVGSGSRRIAIINGRDKAELVRRVVAGAKAHGDNG